MKGRASASGFALLAALLVGVLAATFALVVVGAVHALHVIEAADAAGWRCAQTEAAAVRAVAGCLRWDPAPQGVVTGSDPAHREQWSATWTDVTMSGSGWPSRRSRIASEAGSARRREDVTLELRAEGWATGVSCLGDADVAESFVIGGSGLYVGGCLRGRENVRFVSGGAGVGADGSPLDDARGGGVQPASVHAGAGIFAAGVETHDGGPSPFADDEDLHAGAPVQAEWVEGPTPEFLAAAEAQAERPGDAFIGTVLDLGAISPATAEELLYGRCLLLPWGTDEVTVTGSATAGAGRLLVLVPGDAVVGQPGSRVVLDGGLVVGGRLRVRGDLELRGFLHAGSLEVAGRAQVHVPAGWRARPLAGAVVPVIIESGL